MSIELQKETTAQITVAAENKFLPLVGEFVRKMGRTLGLDGPKAAALEHAVDEAATNVVQHAFEGGEGGTYRVSIIRRPGQVAALIEDRGIPFDIEASRKSDRPGIGYLLMTKYADEIRVENRGTEGMRVEIIKYLDGDDATAYYPPGELISTKNAPVAPADESVTIRKTRPDDAVPLSRCVYRTYGYSYVHQYIYYPQKTREMLESGRMLSWVAVNSADEVIAHAAVLREQADSRIGESAEYMVDPRYRHHGLIEQLAQKSIEQARATGMRGLCATGVTLHTYSQRALSRNGFTETGMLLGVDPQKMVFKAVDGGDQSQRLTCVLYYLPLLKGPPRAIYPPPRHAEMIGRIFDACGLEREIKQSVESIRLPEGPGRIVVGIHPAAGQARMALLEPGMDIVDQVRSHFAELCRQGISCIYLDLPLGLPSAPLICSALEKEGFFFGGVMPATNEGEDILRLQYLNNVSLDLGLVETASEAGRELLEYVTKELQKSGEELGEQAETA